MPLALAMPARVARLKKRMDSLQSGYHRSRRREEISQFFQVSTRDRRHVCRRLLHFALIRRRLLKLRGSLGAQRRLRDHHDRLGLRRRRDGRSQLRRMLVTRGPEPLVAAAQRAALCLAMSSGNELNHELSHNSGNEIFGERGDELVVARRWRWRRIARRRRSRRPTRVRAQPGEYSGQLLLHHGRRRPGELRRAAHIELLELRALTKLRWQRA